MWTPCWQKALSQRCGAQVSSRHRLTYLSLISLLPPPSSCLPLNTPLIYITSLFSLFTHFTHHYLQEEVQATHGKVLTTLKTVSSHSLSPHSFIHLQEEVQATHDKILTTLNTEFELGKAYVAKKKDWLASHWEGFMSPAQLSRIRNTGLFQGLCFEKGIRSEDSETRSRGSFWSCTFLHFPSSPNTVAVWG